MSPNIHPTQATRGDLTDKVKKESQAVATRGIILLAVCQFYNHWMLVFNKSFKNLMHTLWITYLRDKGKRIRYGKLYLSHLRSS